MENSILLPLFLGNIRGFQLIIIIILAVILFGGISRIPEIMRSLGQGVHSFKQGLEDAKEEMNKPIQKAGSSEKRIEEGEKAEAPAAKDKD